MKSTYPISLVVLFSVGVFSYNNFHSEARVASPGKIDIDSSESVTKRPRGELVTTPEVTVLKVNEKKQYKSESPGTGKRSSTVESSFVNPFDTTITATSTSIRTDQSGTTPSRFRTDDRAYDKLAQNLVEVALDDSAEESSGRINIEFTFSPLTGIRYLPIPAIVGRSDPVYAHIMDSQKCTACIVKWQHQDSGEIEILAPVELRARQTKTVFVTPEDGWKRGVFVMSVYDADNSNALIGRSSIRISDINAVSQAIAPNTEFIKSLLESGLAVSKTE